MHAPLWTPQGANTFTEATTGKQTAGLISPPPAATRGNYLRLRQRPGPLALLGQEEAHGQEQLLDAAAELVLVLPARGQGEQPPGLHDVLEQVLLCLKRHFQNVPSRGDQQYLSNRGRRENPGTTFDFQ